MGGTQSCRDGPIHPVARNAKLLQCDVAIDWQEGALFGFCQNLKKQGLPPVLADSIDRCCQRGSTVLGALAGGDSFEMLIEDYPGIHREDIVAALEFASKLSDFQESGYEAVA